MIPKYQVPFNFRKYNIYVNERRWTGKACTRERERERELSIGHETMSRTGGQYFGRNHGKCPRVDVSNGRRVKTQTGRGKETAAETGAPSLHPLFAPLYLRFFLFFSKIFVSRVLFWGLIVKNLRYMGQDELDQRLKILGFIRPSMCST